MNNRIYDLNGKLKYEVRLSGSEKRIYDASGKLLGSIQNNKTYDSNGKLLALGEDISSLTVKVS